MKTMREYTATAGKHSAKIELGDEGTCRFNGKSVACSLRQGSNVSVLRVGTKVYNVYIHKIHELHYEIWINHQVVPVILETATSRLLEKFGTGRTKHVSEYDIKAPMPGLIKEVLVSAGDRVEPGRALIVLEAMKMENEIRSAVHGTVKFVTVQKQDAVEKNQMLIEIEALTND